MNTVPSQNSATTDASAAPITAHSNESFRLLFLGAIGVVYGDIGTSPIYAFREALHAGAGRDAIVHSDIFGVISLIFWALVLVVTVKYVLFVLRADNHGEGGIFSLMELARTALRTKSNLILAIGICGAALFFGDATITPAVSVLSALEGMTLVAPDLEHLVVPLTVAILLSLFAVQRFGTARVATIFGPLTLLWFVALGVFGLLRVIDNPEILMALSPIYAVDYIFANPATAFGAIGAIFLAVTGAEALYADLGHFGRRPIVLAWLSIVFPSLLLNYLGQGAFILSHGQATANPFYQMLPQWALLPMVILATLATIIASQAVITGAFSMAKQAVQLNILPRLEILHTSEKTAGQIYMPRINRILAVVVVILVIGFETSTNLTAAYGISVTGNMVVTTLLLCIVMVRLWKWNLVLSLTICAGFLAIDLTFFAANAAKIHEGGWASIAIAIAVAIIMGSWVRGARRLSEKMHKREVALQTILDSLEKSEPPVVKGTAVFLTANPTMAPSALLHSLKHYKVIHENNVLLCVKTASTPYVDRQDKVEITRLNERFMLVMLSVGYMEQPNIPKSLALCRKLGWTFDIMTTSFFLSRRQLKLARQSLLPRWQARLFISMARSATDATQYFQIPTDRVVEIGTQVNI